MNGKPPVPNPLSVRLALIGAGYYGAILRRRPEGLKDHLDEARKVVQEFVARGIPFSRIEEDLMVVSDGRYNLSEDEYAQKLKQMFEEEEAKAMIKPFEMVYLKAGERVTGNRLAGQLKPVRLAILPEGTLSNKPSLCFIAEDGSGDQFAIQISDEMLSVGIKTATGEKIPLNSLNNQELEERNRILAEAIRQALVAGDDPRVPEMLKKALDGNA